MKTPHKHRDLIIAWANGAEIECRSPRSQNWHPASSPTWTNDIYYRIKPETTQWYNNIPQHGVLCWVWDNDKEIALVSIITSYDPNSSYPYRTSQNLTGWKHAELLNENESKQYLWRAP